jgi:electron-transferring-flavoprotein dehydrogenase
MGVALAGFSHGKLYVPRRKKEPKLDHSALQTFCHGRISNESLSKLEEECAAQHSPLHDRLMDHSGWPQIPFDGQLLISQQDALLTGGSVQAPLGYTNHVVFSSPELCGECEPKLCVEMCSGQAITRGENGVPAFDREKCVFCGACLWNCPVSNINFKAGAGGLHSTLN